MNKIVPGSIKKINESGSAFKMADNISSFQQALLNYGVDDVDIFQTNDLSKREIWGQ